MSCQQSSSGESEKPKPSPVCAQLPTARHATRMTVAPDKYRAVRVLAIVVPSAQ